MSYILDALKKSDQQRQRSMRPTLPAAQAMIAAPGQLISWRYGLIAAALLCVGIVIGWVRPWQSGQDESARISAETRLAPPSRDASKKLSEPVEQEGSAEQALPGRNAGASANTGQVIIPPTTGSAISPSVVVGLTAMPKLKTNTSEQEPRENAVSLAELPVSIRQELPLITVQLHSYSSNPASSIVSINSRMLKEGESLAEGLKLEQITADGVIFSYKGYRFQHGIW